MNRSDPSYINASRSSEGVHANNLCAGERPIRLTDACVSELDFARRTGAGRVMFLATAVANAGFIETLLRRIRLGGRSS